MDCTGCRVTYNILRIMTEELPAIKSFYKDVCGMAYEKEEHPKKHTRHLFVFPWQEVPTALAFEEYDRAELDKDELIIRAGNDPGYWKVGFSVQDVAAAKNYIEAKTDLKVSNPQQFLDVGYLAHFKDPVGYTVELLQSTFEEHFKPSLEEEKTFLGQPKSFPPMLGQITIRCKEPEKMCHFYTYVLGMRLPVIIPVTEKKFTLYFFAYTGLRAPDEYLMGVENREWLWQQNFTQIEITHNHGTESRKDFQFMSNDTLEGGILGHGGYQVVVSRSKYDTMKRMVPYSEKVKHKEMVIHDPDRFRIEVLCHDEIDPNASTFRLF